MSRNRRIPLRAAFAGLLLTGCSESPAPPEVPAFDAGAAPGPVVRVVPFDDPSAAPSSGATQSDADPEGDAGEPLDAGRRPDAGPARAPAPVDAGAVTPDASSPPAATPVTTPVPANPTGASAPPAPTATCSAGVPQTIANPTGAFQVTVLASGRGCPPCTAHTNLGADGQTFTTTFERFEVSAAEVDDAPRECTLAIALRSTSGRAYAVSSVSVRGSLSLLAGEMATQETRHQLGGRAVGGEAADYAVPGPREGAYAHDAPVAATDLVWSDCGPERDLTVSTTLYLTHGEDSKAWVSLQESGNLLRFKLDSRACTP